MLIVVRIMFALRKCFGLFSVYTVTSLDNFWECLVSWWWIFFRIVAIVNILRNRSDHKLALQFFTLKVGLIIECVLLGWFFSIPVMAYLFKWAHWDYGLWSSRLPPLLAMLIAWVLVVVIGLRGDLPNILLPCSGSTSMVCSFLIRYAY